ncbi:MAG: 8-oxoguanine deaminase [Candidatus Hydrogenedentes bacterium CG07_land_8_20_14_0_80_42_17]|nr:MAG: 8-oxoguanine deaminase [Candidatus Hydrogenedentes bacterium CG07_land_8_20_14_0_80_42_17]
MSKVLIKNIKYLLTMSDGVENNLQGASILIEGPEIKKIYMRNDELPESPDVAVIDADHHLVMPGLVNCHHHFYQTLTRNLPGCADAKLFDWLLYLYDIWAEMTPEDIHDASAIAAAELILSGCTTALDHFYVFPRGDNSCFDAEVEGVRQTGLRLHLTRGSMSRSKKDGGLPPDSVVQTDKEIMNHTEEMVSKYHDADRFGMLRVVPAPCSPFSVSTEIMRETAEFAKANDLTIHTHLAETEDEEDFCVKMFGKRPVDYIESVGWLTEGAIFAHSVWVNSAEIKRYAKHKCGIAHCPSSNMRLGSGIAPIVEMLKEGVRVGLGVDGSASNDSSHMIQEMRQCMLLQRVKYGADALSVRDTIRIATKGGAEVLRRDDIGEIRPGFAADLIGVDLNKIWYAGAQSDPPGALALCHTDTIDFSVINGKVVALNGKLTGLDLSALIKRHNKNAEALYKRARK